MPDPKAVLGKRFRDRIDIWAHSQFWHNHSLAVNYLTWNWNSTYDATLYKTIIAASLLNLSNSLWQCLRYNHFTPQRWYLWHYTTQHYTLQWMHWLEIDQYPGDFQTPTQETTITRNELLMCAHKLSVNVHSSTDIGKFLWNWEIKLK